MLKQTRIHPDTPEFKFKQGECFMKVRINPDAIKEIEDFYKDRVRPDNELKMPEGMYGAYEVYMKATRT